jgi:1-acyl-sn-glycerol-3-phosphate acyltransferase
MYLTLNCTFIAKKEIRSWPGLGYVVHKMGVVFLDRRRRADVIRVNEIITTAMSRHQGVVVFPEGTSGPGKEVLPLRSSLFQYPSSTSIPVHAASLYYKTGPNDAPAVESVCFFGGRLPFWNHFIGMARCNSIYCRMQFAAEPVVETNRKELTRKLRSKIEGIFTPSSSEEEISLLAKKSPKLNLKSAGKK